MRANVGGFRAAFPTPDGPCPVAPDVTADLRGSDWGCPVPWQDLLGLVVEPDHQTDVFGPVPLGEHGHHRPHVTPFFVTHHLASGEECFGLGRTSE